MPQLSRRPATGVVRDALFQIALRLQVFAFAGLTQTALSPVARRAAAQMSSLSWSR